MRKEDKKLISDCHMFLKSIKLLDFIDPATYERFNALHSRLSDRVFEADMVDGNHEKDDGVGRPACCKEMRTAFEWGTDLCADGFAFDGNGQLNFYVEMQLKQENVKFCPWCGKAVGA